MRDEWLSRPCPPGLAQGCLDESVRYSREREAFGGPISRFQAIQFKIADMEICTHNGRLAYYHAAAKMAVGEPFKKDAAIAKLIASNAAMDNARDATQIFGGYGFMIEYPWAAPPGLEAADQSHGDRGA